jgi:hypothetical protein
MFTTPAVPLDSWDLQRRSDGAVLVRVHSRDRQGRPLPDAVFSFQFGDPQYDYWERQLRQQMSGPSAAGASFCNTCETRLARS